MIVYIVLRRNGDRYHTYEPDLVCAYFEPGPAEDHAEADRDYYVEEVPLAPQVAQEKAEEEET